MYDKDEEQFKLQVFQQTISTLYMYPLRIYNNNCYEKFEQTLKKDDLEIIKKELALDDNAKFNEVIKTLQYEISNNPQKVSIDSNIYKILSNYVDKIRNIIWKTHASNSLAFVREIKGDRRLWVFLMLYDLFSKEDILRFNKPYVHKCLIGMTSVYIKLDSLYTIAIGRFFTTQSNKEEIIKNILKNYNFENMNIFELKTLAEKRGNIEVLKLKEKALQIKEAFELFNKILPNISAEIDKKELEYISIFIYMLTSKYKKTIDAIETKSLIIKYTNGNFLVKKNKNKKESFSSYFYKVLAKFEHNRNILREEYSSRLKSMLSKRYSGFNRDNYSAIKELLKHICMRLNADAGCYIKYNLADDTLNLETYYDPNEGDESKYAIGIKKYINQINNRKKSVLKRSRVLKVVENYYKKENRYDINELILKNITKDEILQPIEDKPIKSNIALPVTFRHKLLGVLLIDSFRKDSFTEDDINLTLSISSALSVQIFDQIVEENLFSIMENLPKKPELNEEDIKKYFKDLTKYINNIFFSYGIAIWEYNKKEQHFKLKSTTLPIEDIDDCIISDKSNNIIFELFEKDNYTELCDVENSKSLSACNPSKYDPRINCTRIYAIKDEEEIVGALSIYNKTIEDYKSIDIKSLESVLKYMLIFFNIINTIKAQRALIQTEALHEINARFNMVERKTEQLKELLYYHFVELDRYSRYRFEIKLKDINNLVKNTRIAFDYIANKSNRIKYSNSVDDEIENMYKKLHKENTEVSSLKELFNEIINSIPFPYNRKDLKIKLYMSSNIKLKINDLILTDILQNIFLNALKYSFQGTKIECRVKNTDGNILISIKNEGVKINRDEKIDIFMYGYRGFYAKNYSEEIEGEVIEYKNGEKENLGIGLYKSNALVRMIGGEIDLEIDKSLINNGSINRFDIYIPIEYLVKKER